MSSSYHHFMRGKRWKSQEAKSGQMMVGDKTLPIENAAGASLLQLQCAAEDLSWRRTIPEDNISRRFFWIKESNYSMHFVSGGRLYCFRHVYGFTTRSSMTNAMCRGDRRAYLTYCATHLSKASSDSHCDSNIATDRTLEKKYSRRVSSPKFRIFWF